MINRLLSKDIIDKDINAYYCFFNKPKEMTSIHCHDFYEFFIVLSGYVIHNINGNKQRISENHITFIQPDDTHYYDKDNLQESSILNIAFTCELINAALDYLGYDKSIFDVSFFAKPPSTHLKNKQIEYIGRELDELNSLTNSEKLIIKIKLRNILIYILSIYVNTYCTKEIINIPSWLNEVVIDLKKKENFQKGISYLHIHSARSKEHVCREFIKYLGMSPTKFINDIRINYAKNLLINTNINVMDISMECGYENLSYFYHVFKNKYNMSPLNYRKIHRRILIPD